MKYGYGFITCIICRFLTIRAALLTLFGRIVKVNIVPIALSWFQIISNIFDKKLVVSKVENEKKFRNRLFLASILQ